MVPLVVFYACAIAAALVAAPSRGRATMAIALVLGTAIAPWFLPEAWVFARAAYGLGSFVTISGVLDIVRARFTWSATERVLRVLFFVNLQVAKRARRHLDLRLTIVTMMYQAAALTGLWGVVVMAPRFTGPSHWMLRWAGGAIACYSGPEVVRAAVIFGARAIGIEPPELHRTPLVSTSLREFWGARWNLVVNAWLRFHAFEPFAERGMPAVGVLVAFGTSALLHGYFVWLAVSFRLGLVMASFFAAQGLLLLVERAARLARTPENGRIFTIGTLVATSPLFVEPMLRSLGI